MTDIRDIEMFLLDMDGTIYLGNRLFDCTVPFLKLLKAQKKRFLFLTNNSSKSRDVYVDKLLKMGICVKPDDVFTSGEATVIYLNRIKPNMRIYLVGTPALEEEFENAGFTLTDSNPDYAVLSFDTTLTYNKLWKLCDFVRSGLPYIATHPDFNCPTDGGYMPDIGAMIAFVKASAGRVPDVVVGKPNRIICESIMEKYHVKRDALCMVGDRLYTDIALGANADIATALVLSGESTLNDLKTCSVRPDYIFNDLSGIREAIK